MFSYWIDRARDGGGDERKIIIANDTKVFLSGWQKIYIISLSMQDVTAASVESKKASGENKKASEGKSRGGYVDKTLLSLHSSEHFLEW